MNGTDAAPGSDRWSWVTVGVTVLAVTVITGIMAAVSYEHEYQLARRHGQAPWVSSLLPFTVDGMILAASVVILWANSQGIRRPVRPLAVLAVGVGATIAANLAAGIGDGWLGAAVSAWSGVALILISDVAMWLLGTLRALSKGETLHPAVACSCPPAPLTLEEALPLARARLQEDGLPFGKEALAARFKTTPHQVRTALANERGRDGGLLGRGSVPVTQDAPAEGTQGSPPSPAAGDGGRGDTSAAPPAAQSVALALATTYEPPATLSAPGAAGASVNGRGHG